MMRFTAYDTYPSEKAGQSLHWKIAELATASLIEEVHTTPKPGLVDATNTGSHRDMNLYTFEQSAKALKPFWTMFANIGRRTAGESPETTFRLLRPFGKKAEECMYKATEGVNTHKGAIFLLGTVCGAIGRTQSHSANSIMRECAQMTERALLTELSVLKERKTAGQTAGERLLKKYGLSGARGELAAGLPGVKLAIEIFTEAVTYGISRNDAGAITLLYLIARGTDTNMIARGGKKTALEAVQKVKELIRAVHFPDMQAIRKLDDSFIAANLSPGGCADLLAVTYFLYDWQNNY